MGVTRREYDVAVVGPRRARLGGGVLAGAWRARVGGVRAVRVGARARRVRTTTRGSSAARTTRPGTSRLTAAAYEAWQVVEGDAEEQLITRTGGIDIFPPAAAIDPAPYRDSLDAIGVPYELLDAAEIRRRWPAFGRGTTIDGDVSAIYSAETGIVPRGASDRRPAAVGGIPRRRPLPMTPVQSVSPSVDGEVDLVTAPVRFRAGRVVICADAWVNRVFAPLGHAIPITVTLEQVSYFPCHDSDLQLGRFPVWIWMHDPSFYGFPVFGHLDSIKASEDCGGPRSIRTRGRSNRTPAWSTGCGRS